MCSIHYIEQTWDSYFNSLNVWVNLGESADGHEGMGQPDVTVAGLECRDITALMSAADRRELLRAIHHIRLGYVEDPVMGLDGSDHDLTIAFSPSCSIHCHWWTELPAEWRGVKEIVRILRKYASAATAT